jgi:type II secretory pathway pseudopilin PulG
MIRRSGISLVEVLVVASMLVLLVAIALPLLGPVRQSAKVSRSISNLRQLGLALSLYREGAGGGNGEGHLGIGMPPSIHGFIVGQRIPRELLRTGGESHTSDSHGDVYTFLWPRYGEDATVWYAYHEKCGEGSVAIVDETQNPGMAPKGFTLHPRLALGLSMDGSVTRKRAKGDTSDYNLWGCR